jgi:hypothetical protein
LKGNVIAAAKPGTNQYIADSKTKSKTEWAIKKANSKFKF